MSEAEDRLTGSVWRKPAGATSWQVPNLESGRSTGARAEDVAEAPKPPTAAEIEAIREAAHREGFEAGRADGLAAAAKEIDEQRATLQFMATQMVRPLAELDTEVERSLANLALSLARRIVGQVVESETDNLRTLVHRVVSHLGQITSSVDIELCPSDLARLQGLDDLDGHWVLRGNPALTPGDVIVRQADTEIDGRLLKRVESLSAEILEGG